MWFLVFFLLGTVTLLCTSIATLILWIKHRHGYWKRKNFPYLEPRFPLGNLQNPKTRTDSIGIHVTNLYHSARKLSWKHCGVYFYASPVYLVVNLEFLKNIMEADFKYFSHRGMYFNEKDDPISAHLFAVGGDRWRHLRSKLTPTFSPTKLKLMFPTLVECVNLLTNQMWEREGVLEFKDVLARFTTDVIGSCAFGLDFNSIKDDNSPFRVYGRKVFTSTRWRTFKMSLASNFPHVARFLGVTQVDRDTSQFFTGIVRDTMEYRRTHNFHRKDFMQMLMELQDSGDLTFDEIVAQSFIFFLGGFETSSATMTFALYELASNPGIQDKLRNEIREVMAKYDDQVTFDAVMEMKYLDQVVEESLRKYPPLPFVTRTCVENYPIPGTDLILEKGRRVIIPILGIQRDPEYYPDPETFDPDRFNDENKAKRHRYAYVAFGEGHRLCIGMRFGLLQVKVGLVALITKFRFSVNAKTQQPLKMAMNSFTLSADGGIWLDCHKI